MLRIVITGAESTGKTTLATALSGYYGEPWTSEYVRDYVDDIQRQLKEADLEDIARGQINQEDTGLEKSNRLVFHDTNLLSSIIYAKHYFDVSIDWINNAFVERDYALYLLCLPDIPWVADDGQRESPETRDTLHHTFKETLDHLKLPYIEVSGEQVKRMTTAVSAIDALLER